MTAYAIEYTARRNGVQFEDVMEVQDTADITPDQGLEAIALELASKGVDQIVLTSATKVKP